MKSLRLTEQQYAEIQKKRAAPVITSPKRAKYGNEKTVEQGITFASKKEAMRYRELRFMEQAKEIFRLECQVRYLLVVNEVQIAAYVADFRYRRNGEVVVEDVKGRLGGMAFQQFKIKSNLMKALYGIEVQIV